MRFRSSRALIVFAAAATVLAACSSKTPAGAPSGSAPTTLQVKAGMNDPKDVSVAILSFLPSSFTVKTGETVTWTATGPEPHTISFLPTGQPIPTPGTAGALALIAPKPASGPFDGTQTVSSGIGPTSKTPMTFSLSFSKPGTYTFFCAIHAPMRGTVTVVSSASQADSQAAVTQRGDSQQAQYAAEGEAAKAKLLTTPVSKKKNADGTTTWTVVMGAATPHTAVLAYQPAGPAIKAGDRVTFVNESGEPHTATFSLGVPPQQNPEVPVVMKPSGTSPLTVGTKGYFNSGWLPPDVPPGSAPPLAARSFTFVIPKAGNYAFYCVLHIPSGMGGSIKAS